MKTLRALVERVPPWLLLPYAVVFALLARGAHADSEELGYPAIFLFVSAVAHVSIIAALVCQALRLANPTVRALLRALFPVAVIAFVWGMLLDATVPEDYSLLATGPTWLIQSLPVLVFVLPAYAIYLVYAHPRGA
jgi:hypothetical protein